VKTNILLRRTADFSMGLKRRAISSMDLKMNS